MSVNSSLIRFFSKTIWHVTFIDLAILSSVCLIPTLAHFFPSLYFLNPMLFCLLAGVLLVRNKFNAFALAILLPTVSMVVSGMPTPLRCFCIMVEYVALLSSFFFLSKRIHVFPALFISILLSKVAYYSIKTALVAPFIWNSRYILTQIMVSLVYVALFTLINNRLNRSYSD